MALGELQRVFPVLHSFIHGSLSLSRGIERSNLSLNVVIHSDQG
jgi:hypothetical protein